MVLADVGLAVKRLRARRGVVLGVVAMNGIGIGLATAMFALSDPFMARPLPYARADRLVSIDIDPTLFVAAGGRRPSDYPLLRDWQARSELFDGLAAFERRDPLRVRLFDRTVALEAIAVSPNLFDVLGVAAPAAASPTIVGDEAWLTAHAVSGPFATAGARTLSLQPTGSMQVAGVLPQSFLVPAAAERVPVDVLVELPSGPIAVADGGTIKVLNLVGRLHDGVAPAQAEAALGAEAPRRFAVRVRPLVPAMKAENRPLAAGALLAGLLVLAVCAANTLGLALTRGLYGASQIATLEMLGASRWAVARLLLAEAVAVAAAATLVALVAVPPLLDAIVAAVPRNFIVLGAPALSRRVSAFAGLAGLAACAAWWAGSALAWLRGHRVAFRQSATNDGRIVRGIRFGVTAGQVAVTLVLLAGAGLLGRSYLNLAGQATGVSGGTLALSVSYGAEQDGAGLREVVERTLGELRRVPGTRLSAAVVGQMADQFHIVGTVFIDGRMPPVELLWVSPGYFEAAGMELAAGRGLLDSDAGGRGVVVNEALVARYLGGRAAIGDPLWVGGRTSPIVGIARDSRRRALDQAPKPAVFRVLDGSAPAGRVTYLANGATAAVGMWEPAVRRVSPSAVLLDGSTLHARLARTIQDRSFALLVVGLFAAATIVVTAAGVIGVVGYSVARRRREIGIRLAIGATPAGVTWLTMRHACAAIGAGAAAGIVAALWLSRFVSNLLYGVSPWDWPTLVTSALALVGLASTVAGITARRAGRLAPTVALREE